MTTSAIGYSAYGTNNSILNQTSNTSQQTQQANQSENSSDKDGMKATIRSQIDSILANIPKGSDNKLSFKEVQDYYEEQKQLWDDTVKADLEKLGVNTYKQFPLSYDPAEGTVTVAEGHPDKAKIDSYFKANPETVDKFEEIIQIGKLTRSSQQSFTPQEIKQSIQQSAMAVWFQDNSDPSSWFSGGGMMFGNSQASYTGLNMTV